MKRARTWGRWARSPLAVAMLLGLLGAASVGLNVQFQAPPRYDGAGYAVLGRSLSSGLGYREANHPDSPPHSHYPPGYPLVLALLFRAAGPSLAAAHGLSLAFTVGAIVATSFWFRSLYAPHVALLLGASLAVNWTWGRSGGAIQSEPLYLLLSSLALLAASRGKPRTVPGGAVLGALLAACILTRHVGACLALAVLGELTLRRRYSAASATLVMATGLMIPWVAWSIGSGRGTQAGLFAKGEVPALVASQALFYLRRIPDQIAGPAVEIATVFGRSSLASRLATVSAALASGLIALGWCRALRTPRRRLAAIVPLTTFPLLLVWPFTEAGRFLIPLVPFVLLGAAEGLAALLDRVGVRRPRTWAAGLVLAASLPYPSYAIITARSEAQERTHSDFDAACAWIVRHGERPGTVASRYPADVFWQTGRRSLAIRAATPEAIAEELRRYGVAYVVVDPQPFANAPSDPLARLIALQPGRFRLAWGSRGGVAIYRVIPEARRARP